MKILMLTTNSSLMDGINRHILTVSTELNRRSGIDVAVPCAQGCKARLLAYRVGKVQPVEAAEITGQFDSATLVGFAERLDFPSSPL